ncbi:hypothetical protein FA15DRAFT_685959 [Coprinopsis marcescibilis]|uniref:RRM domain-containing protein n=1 Tax=Coprinopsis marcescibilis TaxID=230819 RepID=A0A5C3L3A4_COPMA|nr:hypothetical protein FA15DRAFT_685959 [Coprinopsis marcescibilis]
MAFTFSQRALAQVLRTQTRSLSTSVAARSFVRSTPAITVACSRAAFVKTFSTSTTRFEDGVEAPHQRTPFRERRPVQATQDMRPSKLVFVSNLPFFTKQDEFVKLLEEFGPIKATRWSEGRTGAPRVHVEFENLEDATALVESSKQEPFQYGNRDLFLMYSGPRGPTVDGQTQYPPTFKVIFQRFKGDLTQLREFLGEHSTYVNRAFFFKDKVTLEERDIGMILFSSTERAQAAVEHLNNAVGPDGREVYMRFAAEIQPREDQQRVE